MSSCWVAFQGTQRRHRVRSCREGGAEGRAGGDSGTRSEGGSVGTRGRLGGHGEEATGAALCRREVTVIHTTEDQKQRGRRRGAPWKHVCFKPSAPGSVLQRTCRDGQASHGDTLRVGGRVPARPRGREWRLGGGGESVSTSQSQTLTHVLRWWPGSDSTAHGCAWAGFPESVGPK